MLIHIQLDIKQLQLGDTSELYTKIAEEFPENDWKDIVCNNVEYPSISYKGIELKCHVTIY